MTNPYAPPQAPVEPEQASGPCRFGAGCLGIVAVICGLMAVLGLVQDIVVVVSAFSEGAGNILIVTVLASIALRLPDPIDGIELPAADSEVEDFLERVQALLQ